MTKVLIVDDSAADLENLKSILTKANYQVVTATSGEKAIHLAHAEKPNVILLDIVMQGTDGYRACREITQAEDTKDIPVLFVSSKNQKADAMWARKQGGKALITKPYTEEQIIDQVESFC
ncbi:MAG: response regulator [Pseudomonadales bacterium]|nr:response regulator [Pseudomonadales bacterium]